MFPYLYNRRKAFNLWPSGLDDQLLAYYRMSDKTDSKNSYDLTEVDTVDYAGGGIDGNCVDLDSGYLKTTSLPAASANNQVCYSMWFYIGSVGDKRVFFDTGVDANRLTGVMVDFWGTDGNPNYRVRSQGAVRITVDATPSNDEWHHLMLAIDGDSDVEVARLYVDGSQLGSDWTSASLTPLTSTWLVVGSYNSSTAYRFDDGYIDEFAYWSGDSIFPSSGSAAQKQAKSAFEMDALAKRLYNNGTGAFYPA